MKNVVRQYIILGIFAVLIILIGFFLVSPNEVSSGVLSYKDYDLFYYNGEAYMARFIPPNALSEGSLASIKLSALSGADIEEVFTIKECLNGCDFLDLKLKTEKIGADYVYYILK